uniref:CSN8/PSMD8/EIF3K domain-containing protein n=1 Tax=Callithrix jacchus TaxID=9483 RepID=A0A8I3WIJ5_CALJA
MPVAVMAESAFSFKKLLDQCKNQELKAPGGIATPPVYGQLLALYLLHNDMNNARYLWRRIPPAIKSILEQEWFCPESQLQRPLMFPLTSLFPYQSLLQFPQYSMNSS